jgi:hypothetical protein
MKFDGRVRNSARIDAVLYAIQIGARPLEAPNRRADNVRERSKNGRKEKDFEENARACGMK